MSSRTLVLLPLVLTAALAAQHALVATRGTGARATLLADVDLVGGGVTPLARFPSDHLPPRAIAVDLVNHDLIVALDLGTSSRLVRLQRRAYVLVGEQRLTDLAGVVTRLAFGLEGELFATTDGPNGGLFRLPRTGGAAVPICSAPRATAMMSYGHASGHAFLGQSGAPGADPQVRAVDLATGQNTVGPFAFAGFSPPAITGVVDLQTSLARTVLAHDDGRVSLSVNFATPALLPLPPLAGGIRAMRSLGSEAFVLGGAGHPFMLSFVAWPTAPQWTTRSNALPGDPVDFDFECEVAAAVVVFGAACAPLRLGAGAGGPPRIGNQGFVLDLTGGLRQQQAWLVLGTSDQAAGAIPLPALLPNSACALRTSPDVLLAQTTDALGFATFRLPVPYDPRLYGGILFGQVLQLQGQGALASQGVALHLGY